MRRGKQDIELRKYQSDSKKWREVWGEEREGKEQEWKSRNGLYGETVRDEMLQGYQWLAAPPSKNDPWDIKEKAVFLFPGSEYKPMRNVALTYTDKYINTQIYGF